MAGAWTVNHYASKPAEDKIELVVEQGYNAFLKVGIRIGVLYGGTARSGLFVSSGGGKFVMVDEKGFIAIINEDKITAVVVVPPESETTEELKK
jgi:hypothetical protein